MEPLISRKFLMRLALEGCMVVASILIAFLLDAWWTDREFRQEINQELLSVTRELQDNRQLLSDEIVLIDRISASASALIEQMESVDDKPTVEISDTVAWLVTALGPTLDVSFGAIDALTSSGRLAHIENPELRSGLAGIKGVFDDVVEDELIARQIQLEQQLPMISDSFDLRAVARVDAAVFETGWLPTDPVPSYGTVQYPNNLAIRNVLINRMMWLTSAKFDMARLVEHLDRLIVLMPEAAE